MMVPPAAWIAAALVTTLASVRAESPAPSAAKPARPSVWKTIDLHEEAAKGAAAWAKRLEQAHPELRGPEAPPPADEQNGLLQLAAWLEQDFPALRDDIPAAIRQQKKQWEPDAYAAWSGRHAAALERLDVIALLPQSSRKGLDPARIEAIKDDDLDQIRLLLGFQILYGLHRSDGAYARRADLALQGLARHLAGGEWIGPVDFRRAAAFRRMAIDVPCSAVLESQHPLPAEELKAWRTVLKQAPWQEEMAAVIRGFWYDESRNEVLPVLLHGQTPGFPAAVWTDARTSGAAVAELSAAMIRQTRTASLASYMTGAGLPEWTPPPGLATEARDWVEMIHTKGPLAAGRILAILQVRAALADAAIGAALGETPAAEPATGQPYAVDLKKREVTLPAALQGGIRTMKIPKLKS